MKSVSFQLQTIHFYQWHRWGLLCFFSVLLTDVKNLRFLYSTSKLLFPGTSIMIFHEKATIFVMIKNIFFLQGAHLLQPFCVRKITPLNCHSSLQPHLPTEEVHILLDSIILIFFLPWPIPSSCYRTCSLNFFLPFYKMLTFV